MSRLLYVGTYGTDDPTRASMPFVAAAGALAQGHEASIVLMGEAVYLVKGALADAVQGVGYQPLARLLAETIEAGVPIHVGSSCAKAREVTEAHFEGMNARITHATELSDLMLSHDRVLSF